MRDDASSRAIEPPAIRALPLIYSHPPVRTVIIMRFGYLLFVRIAILAALMAIGVSACDGPAGVTPATQEARPTVPPVPSAIPTPSAPPTPIQPTPTLAVPTVAPPTSTPTPKPRVGGTMRGGVQNDWISMDPLLSANTPDRHMLFDPLVFWRPNADGVWGPAPALVESWELRGTTVLLKLRRGIRFHDGSEWDAQVAKWNLDRYTTNPRSQFRSTLSMVQSVEVVDDLTVRINLKSPQAALLALLSPGQAATPYMVSMAAMEKQGEADFARKSPVGSGPMQFAEWRLADFVALKRWEGYWQRGPEGQALPYLDGITYRLIMDDTARTVELKAGNIDIAEMVQGRDVASIRSNPLLAYTEGPWAGNSYRLAFNATGAPFRDNLRLRQAALCAIDREAIARAVGAGFGSPARYLLTPGILGYDESLPYYRYDPDQARQLLRASQAEVPAVTLLALSRQSERQQAEMIKQMWDAIGLKTTLEFAERTAWMQRTTQSRTFEVTIAHPGPLPDPDQEFARSFSRDGQTLIGIADPEIDRCLEEGRSTYDAKERARVYRRCQRLAYEGAWYEAIWVQPWNWATSRKVRGMLPSWGSSWELREAWLEP